MREASAPDAIEPIRAFRVWRVSGEGRSLRLRSWAKDTIWERRTLQAYCARHPAPDLHCTCGIYAKKSFRTSPYATKGPDLLGIVQLYGRVVLATEGYRAEFARIIELWPTHHQIEMVAELAERYGVRVSDNLLRQWRVPVEPKLRPPQRPPQPPQISAEQWAQIKARIQALRERPPSPHPRVRVSAAARPHSLWTSPDPATAQRIQDLRVRIRTASLMDHLGADAFPTDVVTGIVLRSLKRAG